MILIAPTAFKGTIGAAEAARAMAAGARRAAGGRSVVELPLSDGGPGLLDALRACWGGELEHVRVTGPLAGGPGVAGRSLAAAGAPRAGRAAYGKEGTRVPASSDARVPGDPDASVWASSDASVPASSDASVPANADARSPASSDASGSATAADAETESGAAGVGTDPSPHSASPQDPGGATEGVAGMRGAYVAGQTVVARILRAGGRAVIETADACGLHLVPVDRRDPLVTTSYGLGELIAAVVDGSGLHEPGARTGQPPPCSTSRSGCPQAQPRADLSAVRRSSGGPATELVLGLGGSATVDGGAGMAQALGWRLLDARGNPIPLGGAGLLELQRIDPPEAPTALPPATVLADVSNPLIGELGAATVFGPQKGADARAVRRLERGLQRLAACIRAGLGCDVAELRGSGAAGGLGAGAAAFLEGRLVAGSRWVLDAVGFDAALEQATLVVTGEGRYDAQTSMGKVVGVVLQRARERGVPTLLVAGRIGAPVPAGVVGVDGAGKMLTSGDLEEYVAREVAQLLRDRVRG